MFLYLKLMRVIAKSTLRDYWMKNKECEQALLSWYKIVIKAKWLNFNEVKNQFGSCKIVGIDRIVFKIKGNNFRLIIKISFKNQLIWIRFLGTHSEYNIIDAKTV